jgi:hypothetical protein
MPPPELVEARVDVAGLSDAASALLEEVMPCFRDVSAENAAEFVGSLARLAGEIVHSAAYFVILAFLLPLLELVARKSPVGGLARLPINGELFNITETVFTRVAITGTQNALWNAVLSFLTAHAFSKLEDLFTHSVKSPLLFAEMLRKLFCHALKNDFFATKPFMSSLISVALNIQQTSVHGIG